MNAIKIITPDWDVPADIVAGISTRAGGVSEQPYSSFNLARHVGDSGANVDRNLQLLEKLYPQRLQWQWLHQVHSSNVHRVVKASVAMTADALSTQRPELVCCLLTADCLPVFFAACNGGEVAMAHAGWRGLAAGILENTLASCSTPAHAMVAWLGPAIGPCHFEVGAEVKEIFLAGANNIEDKQALGKCFSETENPGKALCDLYAIAKLKLARLGLERVWGGGSCTFCQPQLFYSFRRDGVTGRMASFIYIDS
jgi:YfiH family protein